MFNQRTPYHTVTQAVEAMLKRKINDHFFLPPSSYLGKYLRLLTLNLKPLYEALTKATVPENIQDILSKTNQYITTAEFNYLSTRNHQKDGPILCKTPKDIIRISVQLPTLAKLYVTTDIAKNATKEEVDILLHTSPMAAIKILANRSYGASGVYGQRVYQETTREIIKSLDLNHLLYECCRNQYVEAAEVLMKKGADVDAIDSYYGLTPLDVACENGNIAIVKLLVKHGARVNGVLPLKYKIRTPMHRALRNKHVDVAQYLRDKNAILAKNRDGQDVGRLFFLGYENKLKELAEQAKIIRDVDIRTSSDILSSAAYLLAINDRIDAFKILRPYEKIYSIPELERKGVPKTEHANFIKIRSKKLQESSILSKSQGRGLF